MLTKKDLANIKEIMVEQMSDMKEQMVTKKEFYELEERFDGLEERFNGLEQEVHELNDYSHMKFVLIENEVIPKISALYEMSDSYVKQMECRQLREKADEKLDCIDPLKAVAKSHSNQLTKHDEMLEKLMTSVG